MLRKPIKTKHFRKAQTLLANIRLNNGIPSLLKLRIKNYFQSLCSPGKEREQIKTKHYQKAQTLLVNV
jgi:hypothetical protein